MVATPATVFERLLGCSPTTAAEHLVESAAVDGSFESQELGRGQASIASTGAILFALARVPVIADDLIREHLADLEKLVSADGTLQQPQRGMGQEKTSWAAGQALCALTARPRLIRDERRVAALAMDVVLRQQPSGGWALRKGHHQTQPLFCVYPLLGILQAHRAGLLADQDFEGALARLDGYLRPLVEAPATEDADRLVSIYCLDRVASVAPEVADSKDVRTAAAALAPRLWRDGTVHLSPSEITVPLQPLWHARPNRSLYYMFARRFWEPTHPISATLGLEIVTSFDRNSLGWRNDPSAVQIYSWTTALGLLATYLLSYDLVAAGIDAVEWQASAHALTAAPKTESAVDGLAALPRRTTRSVRSSVSSFARRLSRRKKGVGEQRAHRWWLDILVALLAGFFGVVGARITAGQPETIGRMTLECSPTEVVAGGEMLLLYQFEFNGDGSKNIGVSAALVSSAGQEFLDRSNDRMVTLGAGGPREVRHSFGIPDNVPPGTYHLQGGLWFGPPREGALQVQAFCTNDILIRP